MSAERPPGAVALTCHPPERRRRPVVLAGGCCSSCCCCCCCCLHAIGGLVGAATAPGPSGGRTRADAADRADPGRPAPRVSVAGRVQALYWATLGPVTLCVVVLTGMTYGVLAGLGMLFFGMPAMQLVVSIGLLPILAGSPPGERETALRTLLSMTWRGLLGALIGLAAMALPYLLVKG